jgi:amidase
MRHLRLPCVSADASPIGINPFDLTAATMRAAYDRGDYRPSDVVRACLDRIRMLEPRLNSFIMVNDRMLEEAARADSEIAAGKPRGPLHGIPVIIKDNMNLAGYRTTAGYAGFAADDRVVDPVAGALNGVDPFRRKMQQLLRG